MECIIPLTVGDSNAEVMVLIVLHSESYSNLIESYRNRKLVKSNREGGDFVEVYLYIKSDVNNSGRCNAY